MSIGKDKQASKQGVEFVIILIQRTDINLGYSYIPPPEAILGRKDY
jgi:hypothetical protein